MFSATQKRWIVVYLLITMPISGASVDIYVPSLPAMTAFFGVDASITQLTITFFLLGYGLFSLFFGPLSDSIGRKPPLLLGVILYVLSAIFIATTSSITVLLLLRFIQGIGVAAIAGVSRTITPDVFQGERYAHVTNMTTIAWSMGPIVAPFIGGYFQHYLSWQWCFYTLALYGLIQLILMLCVLPETLAKKTPFSLSLLCNRSKTLLTSPLFVGSVLISGFVYSSIIVFNTIGPFLIQSVLGRTSIFYGYMALLMGTAFFIGNTVNKRLIASSARRRLDIAICLIMCAVVVESIMLMVFPINVYNIVIPTYIIILSAGLFFPNSYGTALRLHPEFSGTASAILSMTFILTTSLMSAIAAALKAHSQVDFTLLFIAIILLWSLIYFSLFRPSMR